MRDFKVRPPHQRQTDTDCSHSSPFPLSPMSEIDNSQRMQTDPPAGVSASPIADNVMTW